MLTSAEKRGVAWESGGTESLLNLRQRQTNGEWRKSKIYKMWVLLLIIMQCKS